MRDLMRPPQGDHAGGLATRNFQCPQTDGVHVPHERLEVLNGNARCTYNSRDEREGETHSLLRNNRQVNCTLSDAALYIIHMYMYVHMYTHN